MVNFIYLTSNEFLVWKHKINFIQNKANGTLSNEIKISFFFTNFILIQL